MTIPSRPRTHRDVLQHYYDQYDEDVRTGRYQPVIWPWSSVGAMIVITYLLIPHRNRPWLRKLRFAAWLCITGSAAYIIKYTRARGMAAALGVGLVSAWGIIYTGAILVIHDAQLEFQRIERTEGIFGKEESKNQIALSCDTPKGVIANRIVGRKPSHGNVLLREHLGPAQRHGEFAWQPYPLTPFIERLDWVLDIFCNFRGAGWNWRTTSVPPPPKWLQEQLHRNSDTEPLQSMRTHAGQPIVYTTCRDLITANLKTLVTGYLILDGLKTIMMYDPYFWGFTEHTLPSSFPSLLTNSLVLTHIYRMTLSMLAIKWAMKSIFSLAPLFFSGFLGPSVLGARAEPWMYPETWGPYSIVLERGLAGWWSDWWHQTFRFAFEAPSRKLIEVFGMDRRSLLAKTLRLIIAFGLSGFLHACGSHSSAGDTRPITGPMRFFLLQAVAIFVEFALIQALQKRIQKMQWQIPREVMHTITFIYVHVWFYFTAHLLCNDFSKGGVWLFEPVPFSLFRALGLGVQGETWNCVSPKAFFWHSGDQWWSSGIAF